MRCGYCHEAPPPPLEPCPSCGTSLHDDCWVEAEACPTLGCTRVDERAPLRDVARFLAFALLALFGASSVPRRRVGWFCWTYVTAEPPPCRTNRASFVRPGGLRTNVRAGAPNLRAGAPVPEPLGRRWEHLPECDDDCASPAVVPYAPADEEPPARVHDPGYGEHARHVRWAREARRSEERKDRVLLPAEVPA